MKVRRPGAVKHDHDRSAAGQVSRTSLPGPEGFRMVERPWITYLRFANRLVSLLLLVAYFVAAVLQREQPGHGVWVLWLLIPFGCIWFPEAIGDFGGPSRYGPINRSPALLVAIVGWVLLTSPIWFPPFLGLIAG